MLSFKLKELNLLIITSNNNNGVSFIHVEIILQSNKFNSLI